MSIPPEVTLTYKSACPPQSLRTRLPSLKGQSLTSLSSRLNDSDVDNDADDGNRCGADGGGMVNVVL